jgi:hypothetical protein
VDCFKFSLLSSLTYIKRENRVEETIVEFEVIVVIGLAFLFFIGIIYLIAKERNGDKSRVAEGSLWNGLSCRRNRRK